MNADSPAPDSPTPPNAAPAALPAPAPAAAPASSGLPPVTPPSGRFIAQLFLVPGMIVLVAVLIILAINYLFVGGYTPAYFLGKLDSDNADIRWRGASDLAQWIKRKESRQLKTDVAFALDLCDRLRTGFDELTAAERAVAAKLVGQPAADHPKAWRKLEAERLYVEFLASALGDFYAAVGVPILCEIMNDDKTPDEKAATIRRRKAVWALANLGNNVKAARELAEEERRTMSETLRDEAAGSNPRRVVAAATALGYLDPAAPAGDTPVRVDRALARAARSQDRFLREHVAMALNFWDGPEVEATLIRLTRDDGFGTLIRVGDAE